MSFDYNIPSNSVGGALQVEGDSKFNGVALFTGKTTTPRSGGYYWMNGGGTGGTGSSSGNYSMVVSGRLMITGGELNVYSDRRNKENIHTIEQAEALEAVRNVRSVKYRYKTDPAQERLGFIAQELIQHSVFDNLVSKASYGQKERFVLNEQGMIPVLWAAVRELASQIENLKKGK
ncbi:hypothetical protein HDV00_000489 [Rhizophlyctis rosea]|nr:hypothetical protein HDV00_000489 [Rhizophlyctis rosea]